MLRLFLPWRVGFRVTACLEVQQIGSEWGFGGRVDRGRGVGSSHATSRAPRMTRPAAAADQKILGW